MKVLHVIDALGLGGGAEHSLAATLPLLSDRDIDSRIVCLVAREGGLEEDLRSQGFDIATLEPSGRVRQLRSLRSQISEYSPDLVHATLYQSSIAARIASTGLRVPLINSLVNTSYSRIRVERGTISRARLVRSLYVDRFTARRVDRFHAISETVKTEAVEELRVSPDRITVVPRGRSREQLGLPSAERRRANRRLLGISDGAKVLLNVGRQDRQKDHAGLIRAFAMVLADEPDALLLIAGRPGNASGDIQEVLEQTGVSDSVRLLGHRTDVPDLLAAADVFVFPSLYEGLGCSLIEAMALALPIIGSDAPAITEVLGGGDHGIVVPVGDSSRLAAAMIELLTDTALRQEFAERGVERFLAKYTMDVVADETVDMYRAVVEDWLDPSRRHAT